MALGFLLHKGHFEMAMAEVEVLVGICGIIIGDFYVIECVYSRRFNVLAFTKQIYELELKENKIIRKRFIVDLNKYNKFQTRRAHLLPSGHPAMTHPRLARAMVNLSGDKRKILDPFCGGGGILIEAGLCGLRSVGFDIDRKMLMRAKQNLNKYNITGFVLQIQDAVTFSGEFDSIVTDLPYGKSTKITKELHDLYRAFLRNVKKNKIKKAVVGFPDFDDYRAVVSEAKLRIKNEFTYYLHKSLSKKIIVLSNIMVFMIT